MSEPNLGAAIAALSELKPGLDEKLHEYATGGEMKLTIRVIRVIRGEWLLSLFTTYKIGNTQQIAANANTASA